MRRRRARGHPACARRRRAGLSTGCIVVTDLTGKSCDAEHGCVGALVCVNGACVDDAVKDDGVADARDAGRSDDGGAPNDAGGANDGGPNDDAGDDDDAGTDDDAGDDDGGSAAVDAGALDAGAGMDAGSPVECGDGRVRGTEVCDDGDLDDGDGCSGACAVDGALRCEGERSWCGAAGSFVDVRATCADTVRPLFPVARATYFVHAGTSVHPDTVVASDVVAIIVGEPGTRVFSNAGGAVLHVNVGAAFVVLRNLAVEGAGPARPPSVRAASSPRSTAPFGSSDQIGVGVAGTATAVRLERSVVRDNAGGGGVAYALIDIVASLIIDNGTPAPGSAARRSWPRRRASSCERRRQRGEPGRRRRADLQQPDARHRLDPLGHQRPARGVRALRRARLRRLRPGRPHRPRLRHPRAGRRPPAALVPRRRRPARVGGDASARLSAPSRPRSGCGRATRSAGRGVRSRAVEVHR